MSAAALSRGAAVFGRALGKFDFMKQAIAGVTPAELGEATIMTTVPSIAATSLGRTLGQLYSIDSGLSRSLTFGRLITLLSIPVALPLWVGFHLTPGYLKRYRLTNRRLLILRGITAKEEAAVSLDDFDAIDIVVRPGQAWYPAGDLVFRKGTIETFRLYGVSRPEAFRQVCLKAQTAHTLVARVRKAQAARV